MPSSLEGLTQMGRINHILSGDQAGADLEHVEEAKKQLETIQCEMNPGDALFFTQIPFIAQHRTFLTKHDGP